MSRFTIAQTSLSGGEFSPLLYNRNDIEDWQAAASELLNLVPRIEGPVRKRSGTIHVTDARDASAAGRLIPFVKSVGDAVVIEMSDEALRYIDAASHALLEDGGGVIVTATGWAPADIWRLRHFQSADVMWFTDTAGDVTWRRLVRYADDDWDLADYAFDDGPFLDAEVGAVGGLSLNASAATGSITLAGGGGYTFKEKQVGALFRLFINFNAVPFQRWEAEEASITIGDLREYGGRVYAASSNGDCGNQPPVHDAGSATDGGVFWNYRHDLSGIAKITGKSSASWPAIIATANVLSELPQTGLTYYFAEGAFSDYRGYPRLGGIFEERLLWCSTPAQPDTFGASRTGEYSPDNANFKPNEGGGEVLDTHAIIRTLADGEVNVPAWIIANKEIIIGTPRGLLRVSGPSLDEPLTPAGTVARRLPGTYGAYAGAAPAQTDLALLYAGRGGRRLVEYSSDNGRSRDLTVKASHVAQSRIRELAWAGEPYGRLYALMQDGRLWTMVYDRRNELAAWSRVRLGGRYGGREPVIDSICTAPDGQGRDRLWLMVARTVNGATKRTIEVLADDWNGTRQMPEQVVGVDAAKIIDQWNADAAKTITLTAAADAVAGDAVTLAAAGHSPFTGMAGKELRLRRRHLPQETGDSVGDVAIMIDSVASGTSATGTFLSSPAAGHLGVALDQWAWPFTIASGFSHLIGETVSIWADGGDYGDVVVDGSGQVTLPQSAAYAVIGLPYDWKGLSLPLLGQGGRGDSRGAQWHGEAVAVGYQASGEAEVFFRADGVDYRAGPLAQRLPADLLGQPPDLRTAIESVTLECPVSALVQIGVRGSRPGPFTLSFIAGKVRLDED